MRRRRWPRDEARPSPRSPPLALLLTAIDQLYRVLHPEVNLARASAGRPHARSWRSARSRACGQRRSRCVRGALAIFASACLSVLLIEAGVLVSRSPLSAAGARRDPGRGLRRAGALGRAGVALHRAVTRDRFPRPPTRVNRCSRSPSWSAARGGIRSTASSPARSSSSARDASSRSGYASTTCRSSTRTTRARRRPP